MRAAIKHGQTLTMSPVLSPSDIRVGDLVLVQWHEGNIFHLIGEIRGDQFLIVNSLGKVNGWVGGNAILGRVTRIVDPEPQPGVPIMLEQLDTAYHQLIEAAQLIEHDARRLLAVVESLRWYADRIGVERWNKLPRSNKWSFEQELSHLVRQVKNALASAATNPAFYYIDQGNKCVGLAAEIIRLLELNESE